MSSASYPDYNKRRSRLRRRSPVLLVSRPDIYYLSGFTGSSGWLLATSRTATLLTDFRYREQAREEVAPGVEILSSHSDPVRGLAGLVRRRRWRTLEIDETGLSLADYRRISSALPSCRLLPRSSPVRELRMIKDAGELRRLRAAARRCDLVWSKFLPLLRPGMTELGAAALLRKLVAEEGAVPSFEPIVASGAHASHPHARPSRRTLKPGRMLMIDFGLKWKGYHSDLTRTLAPGRFPPRFESVYQAVSAARAAVLEAVRPGVKAASLDRRARKELAVYGLAEYFGHSLGHGLGLEVHEDPRINRRSRAVIREGMVFSLEPGVYIPGWGGVRIEDVVAVEKSGVTVLSRVPRDLESARLPW